MARNAQILYLQDQNKKMTSECQVLTVRILEEKAKMVEIMNEANKMYDGQVKRPGTSLQSY